MKKSKDKVILIVNNLQSNWIPATHQTQFLRDRTNEKIKELGPRFYNIKNLFNSWGLQRDSLFNLARKLESQYYDKKPGIHIQTRDKRIKDAIYIWFAENFYNEILSNDKKIIQELLSIRKSPNKVVIKKRSKQQNQKPNNRTTKKTPQIAKLTEIEKQDNTIIDDLPSNTIFNNLTVNEKIDELEFSNIKKDKLPTDDTYINPNFNIDFLNF